jgi:hypothetical protein
VTTNERHALAILAGCPDGATWLALNQRHVLHETLMYLQADGLIWMQLQQTGARGSDSRQLVVPR